MSKATDKNSTPLSFEDSYDDDSNIPSILDFNPDDIQSEVVSSTGSKPKKSKFNDRSGVSIFNLKLIFDHIDHEFNCLEKYIPECNQAELRRLLKNIKTTSAQAHQYHQADVEASLEIISDLLLNLNKNFSQSEKYLSEECYDIFVSTCAASFNHFHNKIKYLNRTHRFFEQSACFLVSIFFGTIGGITGALAGLSLAVVFAPVMLGTGIFLFAGAAATTGLYIGARLGKWLNRFSSYSSYKAIEINFSDELENCVNQLTDKNSFFQIGAAVSSLYHSDIRLIPSRIKGGYELTAPNQDTAKHLLDRFYRFGMNRQKKIKLTENSDGSIKLSFSELQLEQINSAIEQDQASARMLEDVLKKIIPAVNIIGNINVKIITDMVVKPHLKGYLICCSRESMNKPVLDNLSVLLRLYHIDYDYHENALFIPTLGLTILKNKLNDIQLMCEKLKEFKKAFNIDEIEHRDDQVVLSLWVSVNKKDFSSKLKNKLEQICHIQLPDSHIIRDEKIIISQKDFEKLILSFSEQNDDVEALEADNVYRF